MIEKIIIEITVIIHATENRQNIYNHIQENLGVSENELTVQDLTGHHNNPIQLARYELKNKRAWHILDIIKSNISKDDMEMIFELNDIQSQSALYLRLDKQKIVDDKIIISETGSIRIKIHIPVYTKKGMLKTYRDKLFTN